MSEFPWTVMHKVDETSPLHEVTPQQLEQHKIRLIVMITGILRHSSCRTFLCPYPLTSGVDEKLDSIVHSHHHYRAQDFVFGGSFVDMIKDDPVYASLYLLSSQVSCEQKTGRVVDYANFHKVNYATATDVIELVGGEASQHEH
jgi:hypothetical protein